MISIISLKFSFSVLCFDLDGTIVDHSGCQSKKSIDDLRVLLEEYKRTGTRIVYSTARNFMDTVDVIDKYSLVEAEYLITDLGLNIYKEGKKVEAINIEDRISNWDEKIIDGYLSTRTDLIPRKLERSNKYKKAFYLNATSVGMVTNIVQELKVLGQLVDVVSSGDESVYVVPQSLSKGNSLCALVKSLGVTRSDVVVAGDSLADCSMFAQFEDSILVGNAADDVIKYVRRRYPGVFVSRSLYADGVKEGLIHYDKLRNAPLRAVVAEFWKTPGIFNMASENFIIDIPKTFKGRLVRYLLAGLAYERMGYFEKAREKYKHALGQCNKIFDSYLMCFLRIQMAKIEISLGNLAKGVTSLELLLRVSINSGLRGYLLNSLAYGYRVQGRNNEAFTVLISLTQGAESSIALSATHNLAGLYRDLKEYKNSLDLYDRVLNLAKKQDKDDFFMARVQNNIGFIYRRLGDYDVAEKYYRKSYALEKKIGSLNLQGRTLNNLGGVNRMKGNFKKALSFFEMSVKIRKKIKDKSGLSSSLLNKGIVLTEMGKFKAAKLALLMSYSIRKRMGSKHLINEVLTEIKKIP